MNKKNKQGFTFIEALVVISIIGLLAGIVLLASVNGVRKSRDAQRKKDINTMVSALEQYREAHGCYPGSAYSGTITSSSGLANVLAPAYIQMVPQDPAHDGVTYYYTYDACTTRARIGARTLDIAPDEKEDSAFNAEFNRRLDGKGCGCP